jgi:hypothetical protein
MEAGLSTARQARARHRHELRTLTYVTLDEANGGVVRNLTREGIAAQIVAAVRPRQQLRVRFELRRPRLRVEARGEVVWATLSGQCGIRFIDLPPRMARQIDEWIFGDLLEGVSFETNPVFAEPEADDWNPVRTGSAIVTELTPRDARAQGNPKGKSPAQETNNQAVDEKDGLVVSPAPVKVIKLPAAALGEDEDEDISKPGRIELDWLSQPLTGRGLAWTVNTLVVLAAVLLFVLVFLSFTRETPPRPFLMVTGALVAVAALYWGFIKILGGASFGARLARLAGSDLEEEEARDRFR